MKRFYENFILFKIEGFELKLLKIWKLKMVFYFLTRSSRVNETKIWGFQFRIESGKGCREKQIAHSYSEFQKKSNGVFSGFLSLIDPEIF